MSKLALLFFFILISVADAAFIRPWDNSSWVAENPSIWSYGIEVWWDIDELDRTLESADMGEAHGINGTAKGYADKALEYRKVASANMDACMSRDLAGPIIGTLILGGIGGSVMGAISEFSSVTNCMAYKDNWVRSMDNLLLCLESTTKQSQVSISSAREGYDEIVFMGLCQANYTRSGSEPCTDMAAAFAAVDNNISEGRYGKYALLMDYTGELESELRKPTPDLGLFSSMTALAFGEGGIIESFDVLRNRSAYAKDSASAEYAALFGSADGRRSIVARELAELEKEDIALITIAPSSGGAGSPGSIAERSREVVRREDGVSIEFRDFQLERARVNKRGFMATAIDGMASVDAGYSQLMVDIERLEDDAYIAVDEQEAEARQELGKARDYIQSDARSSESVSLYEAAAAYCEKGQNAGTLGTRFQAFSRCAALSREAGLQRDFSKELSTRSSLSELERLIVAAEKDDINVVTEKESLALLDDLEPYEIGKHLDSARASIILKAKAKYGDELISMRSSLMERISLAGDAASDLMTDIDRCEDGSISAGAIDYPQAIGSLKMLKACYLYTESELEQHISDIVSGSISSSAAVHIGDVILDEPTDITVDIILANTRQFETDQISADVALPSAVPLLQSDITEGHEGIRSIRQKGQALTITLGPIGPYETRRIVFGKSMTVASTLESETEAEGIGNGMARYQKSIEFELGADVPRISLGEMPEDALVDGASVQRPLKAGKHTLSYGGIMAGAYSENITDVKAYRIGLNSHVEYNIRILPMIDLKSVPIIIDSLNDSHIMSLDVASVTGEKVSSEKRVSETQYIARVSNLHRQSPVILKVRYDVEDTESFVEEQLAHMDGTALGNGSRQMLVEAKEQAEAGNFTKALELMEKSKALAKEEQKGQAKLEKAYAESRHALDTELEQIRMALSEAGTNSTFIAKIRARGAELARLSDELESIELKDKVALLEGTDLKWLDKELKSYSKDAFKEYNDLRERLFIAGDTSTPEAFLETESAMNRLESGLRLEYAIDVDRGLASCEGIVEAQEERYANESAMMDDAFDDMASAVQDTLDKYSKEASSAKGTEYSSLFSVSESRVKDSLKEAQKALQGDPRIFQMKLEELNSSMKRMELTLSSLEDESRAKLALLESLYAKSQLSEKGSAGMRDKLSAMRAMVEAGEYVNALRAGSKISKELDEAEPEDGGSLLLLGLSAVAVLAIAGFYMHGQGKQGPPKPLRRLSKADALDRLSRGDSSSGGDTDPKGPSAP